MMRAWIPALLLACCLSNGLLLGQPQLIFSQEVSAFDQAGNPYPTRIIDPAELPGMQRFKFILSPDQTVVIQTNLQDPSGSEIAGMAEIVERCLQYIQRRTGRHLSGDVLLYIIEVDRIPMAYKFTAAYDSEAEWLEVRMALIESSQPLSGPHMAPSLANLLFDTLPHEFGHDVFDGLPQLLVDIDGAPSRHTRWFTEGVCEILARGFAAQEAPRLLPELLARRDAGRIIRERWIETELFEWAQENENSYRLESDLYGAAMLVTLAALERIDLRDLLGQIASGNGVDGPALLALLQRITGMDTAALLHRARQLSMGMGSGERRVAGGER